MPLRRLGFAAGDRACPPWNDDDAAIVRSTTTAPAIRRIPIPVVVTPRSAGTTGTTPTGNTRTHTLRSHCGRGVVLASAGGCRRRAACWWEGAGKGRESEGRGGKGQGRGGASGNPSPQPWQVLRCIKLRDHLHRSLVPSTRQYFLNLRFKKFRRVQKSSEEFRRLLAPLRPWQTSWRETMRAKASKK